MLTIILAETGAGKTTVESQLGLEPIVSTTTRKPRENEINGVHYHFVEPQEFNENDMAALIQIGNNQNWKYGVSKSELINAKYDKIISIISSKYAKDLHDFAISIGIKVNVLYLYVSKEERVNRISKRGESLESINARLDFEDKLSPEELKLIFPNLIVINGEGTQEEVIQRVKDIKNGTSKD